MAKVKVKVPPEKLTSAVAEEPGGSVRCLFFAQGNALGHPPQNTPSPELDRRGDHTTFSTDDTGPAADCMEGLRTATFWPENPTARLPTATGRAASRTDPRATGTGSDSSYVGSGPSYIDSGPSYIGSGSSYIGSGSSYVGSGPSYIGSGSTYVGSGSSYIGFASTYIGSASSYIGFGKTGMLSGLRCAAQREWPAFSPPVGYGRRTRSSSRSVTGGGRGRAVTVVDVAPAAPGTGAPSTVHVWPLGEVSMV